MAEVNDRGGAPKGSLPSLLCEKILLPKIAVTGGIASGKSTVVRFLNDLGLASVSADEVARSLRNDPQTMIDLGRLLGESQAASYDTLREALKHQDKRRTVNHFFHGRVWEILKKTSVPVVEVPLLVESCLWPFFQTVWTVTCSPEIRLNRLVERLGDKPSAEKLIEIQAQNETREVFSDLVLSSDGSLEELNFCVKQGFASLTHGIGRENRL